MHRLRGVIVFLLVVIILLGGAAGGLRTYLPRQAFPQVDGEVRQAQLNAPVEVLRDANGIPHIYASRTYDLFFAQGYVHAQDRFWQMDVWRHTGAGRLSEMFGEGTLQTDAFLRTLGWARVAQQELEAMEPDALAILQAYADGVNAYLGERSGAGLGLEYVVLKLINSSYQPEPWTPLHTLTWGKAMAWDLGGNLSAELMRARLLKTLTPEQVAELIPPYPAEHPTIVEWESSAGRALQGAGDREELLAALLPALDELTGQLANLEGLLGPQEAGIGSNSWVISGALSETGLPILADDPHLGVQMPSIWYEVGLHCEPKGSQCPFKVAGFSFAGVPGVVIGHNDRIAWGFTNVGPDVQDLFIEKINPANPNQYEVNGAWVNMEIIEDTLQVAGSEAVPLTIRLTRNGPVITEIYAPLEEFSEQAGEIGLPEQYAMALRWTALEPTEIFPAVWKMNLAQNWDEFRAGASLFHVPSQNLVYADVDGNIGYQMPGRIPLRAGGDGTLPAPGWTDDYQWLGYIPFEELPFAFNPPQGYIVTANNAVVGPEYPYLITTTWAYGYRAQRIVDLIEGRSGPLGIADMQRMHGDNLDQNAQRLVPVLLSTNLNDAQQTSIRDRLVGWDFQMHMDSNQAAIYAAFWRHLLVEIFSDELPEGQPATGGDRWFTVVRSILDDPANPWWDDRTTPEVEMRDEIFRRAFAAAVRELEQTLGRNPDRWVWGDLHTVSFNSATLGSSGPGFIRALFNRGPFPTSGSSDVVNATGWNAAAGYQVRSVPSMRMIVDLGNLGNSLTMHTTGQSGHADHPHYIDMADRWRSIEYHPMLWERSAVEVEAQSRLLLTP
jgi:penicillin G amidase